MWNFDFERSLYLSITCIRISDRDKSMISFLVLAKMYWICEKGGD